MGRTDGPAGAGHMRTDFIEVTTNMAECQHYETCRAECPSMDPRMRPAPDYLGPRYRGLVIVGANPGIANSGDFEVGDTKRDLLMSRMTKSNSASTYNELTSFLASYMGTWKNNLSNDWFRNFLGYEIEEIAYVNLVKCRTFNTGSNPRRVVGDGITRRCWNEHTSRQISALNPDYVVGHWKPIRATLQWLGYRFETVQYASYSGARNLDYAQRAGDLVPLFKKFSEEK